MPGVSEHDLACLGRAVELAHDAIGLSDPNPRVGCVLHDAHGQLVGEGHTQAAGGAHAEVMALRAAQAGGHSLQGGTAWVSLEPCAHHGRTPPCTDALIAAGLKRVVVAMTDPFPQVAGRGIERLRAAGLQVDVASAGPVVEAARELNIGFLSRVQRQRPWVRLKIAASLDGRTALENGVSQWITSSQARSDGHAWRRRAGAVLSGIGTVLADDPRLDVRLVPTSRQPLRVVVDSRFRLPHGAKVLAPPGQLLVVGAAAEGQRMSALEAVGAQVRCLPLAGSPLRVDLSTLLRQLAAEGVNELHVEAGAELNASLLANNLVDELLLYMAPMLIGPGRALAASPALSDLAQAERWQFHAVDRVGPDLRLLLRRPDAGPPFNG